MHKMRVFSARNTISEPRKSWLNRKWHNFKKYCSWEDLNPLNWTNSEIKMFLSAFFAIMLPVYIFIGLQPIPNAEAASLPKLEIKSISLATPVAPIQLKDRRLIAPNHIAGIYSNAENKLFIIGHSSTVFKKLDQVHIGDTFSYNDITYRIQKLETIPKTEISMSEILQAESEPTIIIMTCAGEPLANQDATHRLIVTATKI